MRELCVCICEHVNCTCSLWCTDAVMAVFKLLALLLELYGCHLHSGQHLSELCTVHSTYVPPSPCRAASALAGDSFKAYVNMGNSTPV